MQYVGAVPKAGDRNVVVRAVRYMAEVHAYSMLKDDTTWFRHSLETLIELAYPGEVRTPEAVEFLTDIRGKQSANGEGGPNNKPGYPDSGLRGEAWKKRGAPPPMYELIIFASGLWLQPVLDRDDAAFGCFNAGPLWQCRFDNNLWPVRFGKELLPDEAHAKHCREEDQNYGSSKEEFMLDRPDNEPTQSLVIWCFIDRGVAAFHWRNVGEKLHP
jgi:hypothetical protein